MPRYYVHVLKESGRSHDFEGIVLRHDEAARRYALKDAADLIVQLRLPPESIERWQLEVVNEAGLRVALVPLSDAASFAAQRTCGGRRKDAGISVQLL